MTDSLSLQNVVTGFAHVKGTKDIMANISYFFELYDDDGDGKVDREGILRISEALLFLSRRGVVDNSPRVSTSEGEGPSRDEQFLSSVSAFIRRCFEYADPAHAMNQEQDKPIQQTTDDLSNFAIGEDDDEDLIDFSEPSSPTKAEATKAEKPPSPDTLLSPTSAQSEQDNPLERVKTNESAKTAKAEAANLALDPNKPLYITLPTFRMVILADEVLEHFFEVGFSSSFRLADDSHRPALTSTSSNLTTFSNAGKGGPGGMGGVGGMSGGGLGGANAGVVPPGKGLRGMLDNIVSDGMRVAAEVRRRMEEVQGEMEREARRGRENDDDEEDEGEDRAGDKELLEGAETADVDTKSGNGELLSVGGEGSGDRDSGSDGKGKGRQRSTSEVSREVVEFER